MKIVKVGSAQSVLVSNRGDSVAHLRTLLT